MLKGLGFMLVLLASTALDGAYWAIALAVCAIGAALMLIPGRRARWTA